jgi:hypothetical protein
MAALAPSPNPRTSTATMKKPGRLRNWRRVFRRSCRKLSKAVMLNALQLDCLGGNAETRGSAVVDRRTFRQKWDTLSAIGTPQRPSVSERVIA